MRADEARQQVDLSIRLQVAVIVKFIRVIRVAK